jgi:hypothetical protein
MHINIHDWVSGEYLGGMMVTAEGAFIVPGLPDPPSGQYRVDLYSGDTYYVGEDYADPVVPGQANINLSPVKGGKIVVYVTGDGQNLFNVCVNAEELNCGSHISGRSTDNDGYCRFIVPVGTYAVRADPNCNPDLLFVSEYWTSAGGDSNCANAEGVTVTLGAETPVGFDLAAGGTILGHIADASGNAISGVQVYAQSGPCNGQWVGGADTDVNGDFEIKGLPAGGVYVRICPACNGQDYVDEWYNGADGIMDCHQALGVTVTAGGIAVLNDTVLEEGNEISGSISGAGVAGMHINLHDWVSGEYLGGMMVTAEGAFIVPGLPDPPSGQYRVDLYSGDTYYVGEDYADPVVPGQANINFIPVKGGKIVGTVTGGGQNLFNVCVNAEELNCGSHIRGRSTDNDGYCRFTVPVGTYAVRADPNCNPDLLFVREYWTSTGGDSNCANAEGVTVSLEAETPVFFDLAPGGSISGSVFNSEGNVITDAEISVHASPVDSIWNGYGTYASKSDGSFTINGLLPGNYKVQINNNQEAGYETRYYFDSPSWHGAQIVTVTEGGGTVLDKNVYLAEGASVDPLNLWMQKRAWVYTCENEFFQSVQTVHIRKEFWVERWDGAAELLSPTITWKPGEAVENVYLDMTQASKGVFADIIVGQNSDDPEYTWTNPGDFNARNFWYGFIASESETTDIQVPADVKRSVDVDSFTAQGDQAVTVEVTVHDPDIRRFEVRIYYEDAKIVNVDEKGGDGSAGYWSKRVENPVAGQKYAFTRILTITPESNNGNPVKYIPRTQIRLYPSYSLLDDSSITISGKNISVADDDIGNFTIAPANNTAWGVVEKEISPRIEIEQKRIIQEINAACPEVISISPDDDTNGYPVGGSIVIQFSEPMDTAITEQNFELMDQFGNYVYDYSSGSIGGTFSWNSLEDTMTFTLSSPLKYSTGYEVAITGRDRAGEWILFSPENHRWGFVTEADPGDIYSPRVLSVWPADSSVNVPTTGSNAIWFNTHISVQFSEAMDLNSLDSGSVLLINTETGIPVACGLAYESRFFEILPDSPLLPGTTYEARLLTSIKDAAGNPLASSYTWQFTTGAADHIPPSVVETTPANGASDLSIWFPRINIYFSEELDPETINKTTIIMRDDGGNEIDFYPYCIIQQYGIQFRPGASRRFLALDTNRAYTITIGTGVTDMAGVPLAEPYVYTFRTVAAEGNSRPGLSRIQNLKVNHTSDGIKFKCKVYSEDHDWYWPGENQTVTFTDGVTTWPLQELGNNWEYYYKTGDGINEPLSFGNQSLTFSMTDTAGNSVFKSLDVYVFEEIPEILLPVEGQPVSAPVTIRWNHINHAQLYKIFIFNGADPESDPVLWTGYISNDDRQVYEISLPEEIGLSDGSYYYCQVQAHAGVDNISPYGLSTSGAGFVYYASVDTDNDGLPDDMENTGCTYPDNPDSDDDGLVDGDEDANRNGVKDLDETDPCNPDTDGDKMPDGWEIENRFNPLINDAQEDGDQDGFTNIREYVAETDPDDGNDIPDYESEIEDFETGDFKKYPWLTNGDDLWMVSDLNPVLGEYSAESPAMGDEQAAILEINSYCETGEISFQYSVDSEQSNDFLNFYIDGILKDQWSGNIPYTLASYSLTTGMHHFAWVYSKDATGSGGDDKVWLDEISFPGAVDSDSDKMPDGWELENDLDPFNLDSMADSDGDLFSNHMECLTGTNPQNQEDFPSVSNGFDADFDLDGTDLIRFANGLSTGLLTATQLQEFAGTFGK